MFVVLSLGSQNNFDATPLTCSERVSLESTIPTKLMITRKFETNAKNNTYRNWQLESAQRLPEESLVKVVCKLLKSRQIQANIKSSQVFELAKLGVDEVKGHTNQWLLQSCRTRRKDCSHDQPCKITIGKTVPAVRSGIYRFVQDDFKEIIKKRETKAIQRKGQTFHSASNISQKTTKRLFVFTFLSSILIMKVHTKKILCIFRSQFYIASSHACRISHKHLLQAWKKLG